MEFKGTKGKWVVDNEESGYNEYHQLCTPISRIDKSYSTIVGLCDVYGNNEEAKANALLISKAPELLELLIKLCKLNPTNSLQIAELMDKAEVLIKEATEIH